jgi:hypothetical protein
MFGATSCLPADDKCTDFQGDQVDVSDKGCHGGRVESKSLSFSGVEDSKEYCLVKFDNDDCGGLGMRQDVSTDSKGKSQPPTRQHVWEQDSNGLTSSRCM